MMQAYDRGFPLVARMPLCDCYELQVDCYELCRLYCCWSLERSKDQRYVTNRVLVLVLA